MNKKLLIVLILILCLSLAFIFCSSEENTVNNTENTNETNNTPNNTDNTEEETSMEEPDWSLAEEQTLVGKIEMGKYDMVTIVTEWESKSRVSYYVFGDALAKELMNNVGKFAEVKGLIPTKENQMSDWSKRILVTEILQISENPIE